MKEESRGGGGKKKKLPGPKEWNRQGLSRSVLYQRMRLFTGKALANGTHIERKKGGFLPAKVDNPETGVKVHPSKGPRDEVRGGRKRPVEIFDAGPRVWTMSKTGRVGNLVGASR